MTPRPFSLHASVAVTNGSLRRYCGELPYNRASLVLTPGTCLGPYGVTAQIGVGGMGEVYRATDTNLKRAVAIKVLPASVALDVERLARFQREAEILAALNDVAGGVVQTIAKTSPASAAGGTWNEQNTILFSRGGNDGILRVAAGGGEPERLTTTDTATGLAGLFPTFLPGGRHFLYLKIVGPSIAENSQLMWRALDSADERVVRSMGPKASIPPTGHLLFSLGGPVVAQQFDASNGTVSGDPVQLVGDTVKEGSSTSLAFSPAGVLAHRAGSASTHS